MSCFVCKPCKVMDVLMSLQGSQMEADDPTTSYMLQVCFLHKLQRPSLKCSAFLCLLNGQMLRNTFCLTNNFFDKSFV